MSDTAPARRFPWWGTIILAIAAYCSLKYGAPLLTTGKPELDAFLRQTPALAPIVTIPLLLLAAKQLYDIPSANPPDADEPAEKKDDSDEEPPTISRNGSSGD